MNKLPYLHISHWILVLVMVFVIGIVVSCSHNSAVDRQMTTAENLMAQHPDSALSVLDGIDTKLLGTKAEKARYALLMSQALDKNYIDATNFDVLQPTIDYYPDNGTPDKKLKTYYYQGRIYQNKCDYDNAMLSFINAREVENITDTLALAHLLVAQGTLYFRQYKTANFVANNLSAAKLYGTIGKHILEIKSYGNALSGAIQADEKAKSDSIKNICLELTTKYPNGIDYFISPYISYTIEYGSDDEIRDMLQTMKPEDLTEADILNFAYGYSKIGDNKSALSLIENAEVRPFLSDTLKYFAVKSDILERAELHADALHAYKEYNRNLEKYHSQLFEQDLLFAEKRHSLETATLKEKAEKERIIWMSIGGFLLLGIIIGFIYFRLRISRSKRIIAENENQRLQLEKDNLNLQISQIEAECDNLKQILNNSGLSEPASKAIKERIQLLNGLVAAHITSNDAYSKPYSEWIKTISEDREKFMNSTRLAFKASHPRFIDYLEKHGLTEDEINYLCLYALGMKGKEVGNYIQLKRHYNISSEIRAKLGLDEHQTNLGIYVRKLMTSF